MKPITENFPGDFRPKAAFNGKLDRSAGPLSIELEPTDDILTGLRPLKRKQIIVGFAAEAGIDIGKIRRKLESKGVDMLVVNDISRRDIGFASDENEVEIHMPGTEPVHLPKAGKDRVAGAIWDRINLYHFRRHARKKEMN